MLLQTTFEKVKKSTIYNILTITNSILGKHGIALKKQKIFKKQLNLNLNALNIYH